MIPPIIPIAMPLKLTLLPATSDMAIGSNPQTVVSAVMKTGRIRSSTALMMACPEGIPLLSNCNILSRDNLSKLWIKLIY